MWVGYARVTISTERTATMSRCESSSLRTVFLKAILVAWKAETMTGTVQQETDQQNGCYDAPEHHTFHGTSRFLG